MPEPNMSLAEYEAWLDTQAFEEWRQDRDSARYPGYVRREIVPRVKAVIRGEATEKQRAKVSSFISRMRENDAGERKYGSGRTAVSAKTASLRSWGWQ